MKLPLPEELKHGGLLLVDKPYKWTSFDAINLLKITLRTKVGHAGTLDPLATGLLVCCTGDMTRKISDYQQLPKEYTGIIELGATTATFDLESQPAPAGAYHHISDTAILSAASGFTGSIMQVPPAHSAIKKDGKRSYQLARAGVDVALDARPVTIDLFEITSIALPELHFRVQCSTGTYIRSLAADLGAALHCGAYLKALRRTRIGLFRVEDALAPADWKLKWKNAAAPQLGGV